LDASEEATIADHLLMSVLNLFFVLKKTVVEFYCQEQIKTGQGFKMIAENGGVVQDCNEAEFASMPRSAIEIYKNHEVCTLNILLKNK
jgi:hypothetical protein